jgi:hypothetical protein
MSFAILRGRFENAWSDAAGYDSSWGRRTPGDARPEVYDDGKKQEKIVSRKRHTVMDTDGRL